MTPRVVIVGAGFAGFHAAQWLCKHLHEVEVTLVNPTDYFLYVPLLPEVMAGILDPRRVAVSIASSLPQVKLVIGAVHAVDLGARTVHLRDGDGRDRQLGYDQVLLTVGSVNKVLPVPGADQHAIGFRNLAEAVYLRDHLLRQLELADGSDDPDERAARLTFVVVGAGYTGTEVAGQGVRITQRLLRRHPRLAGNRVQWILLDTASRVLPGLSTRLSRIAAGSLAAHDVDVRLGTSVAEATASAVELSDGSRVPTHSLIWCVGVRPDPLVGMLNLPLEQGRLVVDEYLAVPGCTAVWACGDAAAVPDLTRPGEITAMTAQHAERQGRRAAKNIAAAFGHGTRRPYRHHDLGFVVDLGGADAAADPLGIPLGRLPAKVVARGYHLFALPGNRLRTAAQWLGHAVLGPEELQLNLVARDRAKLPSANPPELN